MSKTKEQIKEYNRLKAQESRAKKKVLGLPVNSSEVNNKAQSRFLEGKKSLKFTVSDKEFLSFENKCKELNISKLEGFKKMLESFI